MRKEASPAFRSTPDKILARIVAAQQRMAGGLSLQECVQGDAPGPIFHHTLLTILRHQAVIDWLLDRHASGRVRPRLRRVLRWGLAQVLYMHGLPAPVAADTCVRFVRRRCGRHEAGFVNALIRRLAAAGSERLLADVANDAPAAVALELGEPLYAKWSDRFAADELARLSDVLLTPAPLTVRLLPGAPEPGLAFLTPMPRPSWARSASLWSCADPAAFFQSAEFARGDFYVQDPSTLLAPTLLAVTRGERVADVCSAPGGKSLVLAEALAGQGGLVCSDRSWRRMQRVRQNLARTSRVHLAVADVAAAPFRRGAFDAILLDVPCTNTGVVRRRPDVRWRFSEQKLQELVRVQEQILLAAAELVKPGGRVVYSTCSIEPEENALQVEKFVARRADFAQVEACELLPASGHDGAFAALLVREPDKTR